MTEILQYEFMRNALIGGLFASVACGVIGSFIVTKRLVFISGGISHSAFGGVGLGYLLGLNPHVGAVVFGVLSSLGIGFLTKKTKLREDTSIGIFWTLGMGLGILFIHMSKGYAPDLFTYLFGNILAITSLDLKLMLALDAVILVVVGLLYKEFLSLSFNEEFSKVRGIPVFGLYLLLLGLIALGIIVLIKIVGIILVLALLTLPAATSSRFVSTLKGMIALSIFLSAFFILSGLVVSYYFNLPAGATIVLVSAAIFLISRLFVLPRKK